MKINCKSEWKKWADSFSVQKWYDIFLAMIFAACTVLMTRLQFSGDLWGSISENYIKGFGKSAVFLFVILFCFFYWLIRQLDPALYRWFGKVCPAEESKENAKKVLIFWSIVILAAWLPYYLSYYPGGVYADTVISIKYYFSEKLSNRHPYLYNTLIGIAIQAGESLNKDLIWSVGLFTGLQMLLLEAEIIYFLHWMMKHRVQKKLRTGIMLFLIFCPLIPLYSISVWKDTPFCMAVMLWSMFWIDLYLNIQKNQWSGKTLAGFVIGALLTAFTRNNGIYVIGLTALALILMTCRQKFQKKILTYVIALLPVFLSAWIQGPVYDWAGIDKTDAVENFGIPLQQIGSVVAYDGKITEEQMESLRHFFPYDENIKKHFSPCLADNLKWQAGLDDDYLMENQGEFLSLWFQLLRQNPKLYVKEYLMETAGFWNVDVATSDAYVQNFMWVPVIDKRGEHKLEQTDYFEKWFGFSFQHYVNPEYYISAAWFFWAFFVAAVFVMKHYGWKQISLFVPQLGIWLTLMAATPIAVSLRYLAALLFTLPLILIVPVLLQREQENDFNTGMNHK